MPIILQNSILIGGGGESLSPIALAVAQIASRTPGAPTLSPADIASIETEIITEESNVVATRWDVDTTLPLPNITIIGSPTWEPVYYRPSSSQLILHTSTNINSPTNITYIFPSISTVAQDEWLYSFTSADLRLMDVQFGAPINLLDYEPIVAGATVGLRLRSGTGPADVSNAALISLRTSIREPYPQERFPQSCGSIEFTDTVTAGAGASYFQAITDITGLLDLDIRNDSNRDPITSFPVGAFSSTGVANLTDLDLTNNSIDAAEVDRLIIELDDASFAGDLTIVTGNASPTSTSAGAVASIEGRGGSVS